MTSQGHPMLIQFRELRTVVTPFHIVPNTQQFLLKAHRVLPRVTWLKWFAKPWLIVPTRFQQLPIWSGTSKDSSPPSSEWLTDTDLGEWGVNTILRDGFWSNDLLNNNLVIIRPALLKLVSADIFFVCLLWILFANYFLSNNLLLIPHEKVTDEHDWRSHSTIWQNWFRNRDDCWFPCKIHYQFCGPCWPHVPAPIQVSEHLCMYSVVHLNFSNCKHLSFLFSIFFFVGFNVTIFHFEHSLFQTNCFLTSASGLSRIFSTFY